MKGMVTLVGAGPGDPGLLTVKGREALERAQVVVYDRLVSPAILALMPEGAEQINVGKEASHHPVPQEQINQILLDKALEGKRVVLIDDSIVRGTTCRRTIDLLRKAGAKEIHMRVSAPPFVAACYYGTDIDDPSKLIANNHSVEEIAKIIGVDSLGYLSLQDVVKLADNTECGFCPACFGGGYPTSIPQDSNKDRFECKISEREKQESV